MKTILHILNWILKLLVWIAKSFGLLFAIGLLFAYLSCYVSPATTWFFAFFGLIFPILFFINILLFVFWLILKQKFFLVHLAVLALSVFFVPAYVQLSIFTKQETAVTPANELKVMSYNVHVFGVNYQTKTFKTLSNIAEFVKKENPDILCLQEIVVFDTDLLKKSFPDYPYIHYHLWSRRGGSKYGAALLSRHPFEDKGVILFSNTSGNVCLYADIKKEENIVRVYNNHLESTGLNLRLSFSRMAKDERRNEEIKEVSTRLRDAFIKRANQVDTVAAHAAKSPYPVLICGDFNDLPMSYTYRKMKGNRSDSFIAAGSGIPSSFRSFIPAFRIDYIFSDEFFKATNYYIPKVEYSDHYPVVTVFSMNQ